MMVSLDRLLRRVLVFLVSAIGVAEGSLAKDKEQKANPAILTLDRIFSDREFSVKRPSIQWQGESHGYTKKTDEGIMRYSAGSRRGKLLVPIDDLIPPGETTPLEIDKLS